MAKLYSRALREVAEELDRAIRKHKKFPTMHHGYAVILEEVRELEREVFRSPKKFSEKKTRKEAMQVAAMAVRFIMDTCR